MIMHALVMDHWTHSRHPRPDGATCRVFTGTGGVSQGPYQLCFVITLAVLSQTGHFYRAWLKNDCAMFHRNPCQFRLPGSPKIAFVSQSHDFPCENRVSAERLTSGSLRSPTMVLTSSQRLAYSASDSPGSCLLAVFPRLYKTTWRGQVARLAQTENVNWRETKKSRFRV